MSITSYFGNRWCSLEEQNFVELLDKELTGFLNRAKYNKVLTFPPLPARLRFLTHKVVESYPRLASSSIGREPNRRTVVYFVNTSVYNRNGQSMNSPQQATSSSSDGCTNLAGKERGQASGMSREHKVTESRAGPSSRIDCSKKQCSPKNSPSRSRRPAQALYQPGAFHKQRNHDKGDHRASTVSGQLTCQSEVNTNGGKDKKCLLPRPMLTAKQGRNEKTLSDEDGVSSSSNIVNEGRYCSTNADLETSTPSGQIRNNATCLSDNSEQISLDAEDVIGMNEQGTISSVKDKLDHMDVDTSGNSDCVSTQVDHMDHNGTQWDKSDTVDHVGTQADNSRPIGVTCSMELLDGNETCDGGFDCSVDTIDDDPTTESCAGDHATGTLISNSCPGNPGDPIHHGSSSDVVDTEKDNTTDKDKIMNPFLCDTSEIVASDKCTGETLNLSDVQASLEDLMKEKALCPQVESNIMNNDVPMENSEAANLNKTEPEESQCISNNEKIIHTTDSFANNDCQLHVQEMPPCGNPPDSTSLSEEEPKMRSKPAVVSKVDVTCTCSDYSESTTTFVQEDLSTVSEIKEDEKMKHKSKRQCKKEAKAKKKEGKSKKSRSAAKPSMTAQKSNLKCEEVVNEITQDKIAQQSMPNEENEKTKEENKVKRSEKQIKTEEGGEEEQDDWETNWDEDGECLNSATLAELHEIVDVEKVEIEKPKYDYYSFKPKDIVLESGVFDHVVEIYDFSPELKTQDLVHALSKFKTQSDIHWVDDTHALAGFSNHKTAQLAIEQCSSPMLKLRPLYEGIHESKLKAKRNIDFLQPYKERPKTSKLIANRLVTGALGVRSKMSKEERQLEREKIKAEREEKQKKEKQKRDLWESEDLGHK